MALFLSPAQRSLFFLNELTQGRPVYNMPVAFRLRGDLDTAALNHALHELVERHESLRSEIADDRQIARPASEFAPQWHDLSRHPDPEALLGENVNSCIQRFALKGELPFRANVFRLS